MALENYSLLASRFRHFCEEYGKLGFLDPRKFYDEEGSLIPVHKLPAEVAAALTGMDVASSVNAADESFETIKKIKFADKKGALDSIAKHLKMFDGESINVNLRTPPVLNVIFQRIENADNLIA